MSGARFFLRCFSVFSVLLALAWIGRPVVSVATPQAERTVALSSGEPRQVPSCAAAGVSPVAEVPPAGRVAARGNAVTAQEVVLLDQPISSENLFPYADQDFETAQDSYDIFLVDDFSNAVTWEIRSIFVPGYIELDGCGLDCADSLNFQIYGNSGGVPNGYPNGGLGGGGELPVWSVSLPPTDSQILLELGPGGYDSNVTLTLDTPVRLAPGTYWLVFYPTMASPPPTGACCQYYRFASDTSHGYTAQVINPGGAFGFPAVWTSMQSPLTWSMPQQDVAFRINGVVVRSIALPAVFGVLLGN